MTNYKLVSFLGNIAVYSRALVIQQFIVELIIGFNKKNNWL